jgi:hypothetical protein
VKYELRWRIELEGDDPYLAALQATQIQQDPSSTAHVWDVVEEQGGLMHEIDLDQPLGKMVAPVGSLVGLSLQELQAMADRYHKA